LATRGQRLPARVSGCTLYKFFFNTENNRTSRDLIYEAMKMRTGNSKPRSPDDKIIVGGGIVEKKLQQISSEIMNGEADIESRGKIS